MYLVNSKVAEVLVRWPKKPPLLAFLGELLKPGQSPETPLPVVPPPRVLEQRHGGPMIEPSPQPVVELRIYQIPVHVMISRNNNDLHARQLTTHVF